MLLVLKPLDRTRPAVSPLLPLLHCFSFILRDMRVASSVTDTFTESNYYYKVVASGNVRNSVIVLKLCTAHRAPEAPTSHTSAAVEGKPKGRLEVFNKKLREHNLVSP